MRPRTVGLMIALSVLLSFLFVMIAQHSLKSDQKRKQQQLQGATTTSARRSFDLATDSPLTWFDNLKWYLAKLTGFDLGPEEEEREPFHPTKLGHLNYKTGRYANSIDNFVSVTISPIRVSDNSIKSDSIKNNRSGNSDYYETGSQPQVQYNDHMTSISDSILVQNDNLENKPTIDLISASRMDREAIAKQQQQQKQQNGSNDDHNGSMLSVMCPNFDFDRLIAQKISTNNISQPIVTSDGRFDNPFPTWSKQSLVDIIKFVAWEADESNVPKNKDELDKELPMIKPNFNDHLPQNDTDQFRVTWIGHATLLIQVDGYNILTDPMFSDRASFTQFFGPKRIRQPACDIKSLPHIDIVLISHNHYDHLDVNSVQELNYRFGRECRWIVPLGIGEFLRSMSVENYVELDWWQKDCFLVDNNQQTTQLMDMKLSSTNTTTTDQSISAREDQLPVNIKAPYITNASDTNGQLSPLRKQRLALDIYLTPSQHWSRRGINDVNKSLWGSFVIVNKNGFRFFFGGDTAYCSAFKEIGSIFGPFLGAAIPIGAYKPRWFLKASHVDPYEAVQIHKDLQSMKSIAIHHSTFILSNENYKEPSQLLKEIMDKQRVNGRIKDPFISLKHGETAQFSRA